MEPSRAVVTPPQPRDGPKVPALPLARIGAAVVSRLAMPASGSSQSSSGSSTSSSSSSSPRSSTSHGGIRNDDDDRQSRTPHKTTTTTTAPTNTETPAAEAIDTLPGILAFLRHAESRIRPIKNDKVVHNIGPHLTFSRLRRIAYNLKRMEGRDQLSEA